MFMKTPFFWSLKRLRMFVAGYVGLYSRRISDATCFPPPKYNRLEQIQTNVVLPATSASQTVLQMTSQTTSDVHGGTRPPISTTTRTTSEETPSITSNSTELNNESTDSVSSEPTSKESGVTTPPSIITSEGNIGSGIRLSTVNGMHCKRKNKKYARVCLSLGKRMSNKLVFAKMNALFITVRFNFCSGSSAAWLEVWSRGGKT